MAERLAVRMEACEPDITIHCMDGRLNQDDAKAWVRQWLEKPWNFVLVDTFPRGILGELAEPLKMRRQDWALMARPLRAVYSGRNEVLAARDTYDVIIAPDGIVTLDADELPSRRSLREAWSIPAHTRVIGVMGTGTSKDVETMKRIANRIESTARPPDTEVAFISNDEASFVWPAQALMPGIDILLAPGGFNTVQEVLALGCPYIGIPFDRKYDDQVARLRQHGFATWSATQPLTTLIEMLDHGPQPPEAPVNFVNRAHSVAQDIMQRIVGAPSP
jgi:hypothetical protein